MRPLSTWSGMSTPKLRMDAFDDSSKEEEESQDSEGEDEGEGDTEVSDESIENGEDEDEFPPAKRAAKVGLPDDDDEEIGDSQEYDDEEDEFEEKEYGDEEDQDDEDYEDENGDDYEDEDDVSEEVRIFFLVSPILKTLKKDSLRRMTSLLMQRGALGPSGRLRNPSIISGTRLRLEALPHLLALLHPVLPSGHPSRLLAVALHLLDPLHLAQPLGPRHQVRPSVPRPNPLPHSEARHLLPPLLAPRQLLEMAPLPPLSFRRLGPPLDRHLLSPNQKQRLNPRPSLPLSPKSSQK